MIVEERDTTLIVKGKIKLIDGRATVLGCPVKEVSSDSYFPLYIEEGKVAVEGEFIPLRGSTIPRSWIKLSEIAHEVNKVILVGETDTGKSSLAVWLINNSDAETCVVDADIGQADIAHPGAMGIGFAERTPFLRDVEMLDGFFVGAITPAGREAKCLRGFAYLCKKAEKLKKKLIIVNTTGWINGRRAREYKLAKFEIFSPDLVVSLGVELCNLYDVDAECIRVDSFVPKKRSRELRLEIRSKLYRKWLEPARSFVVDASVLRGTTLFRGKTIRDSDLLSALSVFGDVIFAEAGKYFLNVCVDRADVSVEAVKAVKNIFGVDEVNVFEYEWFKGLICGIYSDKKYVCPGLVEEIDFENRKVSLIARESPTFVELGEFRLVEGREVFVRIP
jgi:polynucleotide 5'-hydroxyl-kinase GRC3/NOL9